MNYYEVLGIRPSALAQEIELAYKGRRTQYHPDKYSEADASTVEWATQQMQLVNEAYSILSSPTKREAYDETLELKAQEEDDEVDDENETSESYEDEPEKQEQPFTGVKVVQGFPPMSLKQKLIYGYLVIAVLFALYGWLFGDTSHKSFAANLGRGIVWPVLIFPSLGVIIGGAVLVVVFLFVMWS